MSERATKPGWRRVRFGDVVRQVKDRVDPNISKLERYVAGEHMNPDDLRIRRWGRIGDGYLGPAFHMRFRKGHVLYGSRRTYLRKVAMADFDGICANTTFVLEPRGSELLREFLPIVMQSSAFGEHSVKQSRGSVNPYVNFSDLAWYEFALPALEVQERIVELLSASNTLVVETTSALESAGALAQALADELVRGVVGSGEASALQLSDILAGSPESGCSAPEVAANTGHFVLALSALTKSGYRPGEWKAVSPTPEMRGALLKRGDLLISRSNTRDRVGYVGVFDENADNVSFPDTMMRLRVNPALVLSEYLEMVLQTAQARSFLMGIAAGTSASMKKINRKNLLQMQLWVPTLQRQAELLHRLQQVRSAVSSVCDRQASARRLHEALREHAIAGIGA